MKRLVAAEKKREYIAAPETITYLLESWRHRLKKQRGLLVLVLPQE
jgi:hypothetical protein